MSAEHGDIDLDQHNHELAGSSSITHNRLAARQKMVPRLVAAFVAGVVLGGIGVNELRDSREQRERTASVSLVAVPESAGSAGSDSQGIVQLEGQLAVINAGPAPITVRGATAQRPGVLISATGQSRLLRPGGTGQIDVKLRLECATAFGIEPLSMRFSVETDDKQVREVNYPVALAGSIWHHVAMQPCERRR